MQSSVDSLMYSILIPWFDDFEKANKKFKEYTEKREYDELRDRSSRLVKSGLCTKEQLKQINEILLLFVGV